MATTLSSTHSQPFIPVPDFIQQARTCENIINTLGESDDPEPLTQHTPPPHTLCARSAMPAGQDPAR